MLRGRIRNGPVTPALGGTHRYGHPLGLILGTSGPEVAPEVTVIPGGGAGWDESPLDIQIPDDARELDRDVLAYHREQRAKRRRSRLRRLAGPLAGHGAIMPLLASILAVCLVAGAMLSVATFSPATAPDVRTPAPTLAASSSPPRPSPTGSVPSSPAASPSTAPSRLATARASGTGRHASPSALASASASASASQRSPSGTP